MKLWFENQFGEKRVIKNQCNTWKEVSQAIHEFIDENNKNKKHPFKSFYMRVWEEDGMTKIDVGSHTEFFYWKGKYPVDHALRQEC